MSNTRQSDFDILIEHGVDIRKRALYLQGDVDHAVIHKFIRILKYLDKTQGDIQIILDSEGGDVNLGLATYDAIQNCTNPVEIRVEGVAMSMGSIILQAADHRVITRHSRIMIHRGSAGMEGNLKDVERAMEETKRLDKLCCDIYFERMKKKDAKVRRAKLEKMMDYDTYISADEALEIGFVDDID